MEVGLFVAAHKVVLFYTRGEVVRHGVLGNRLAP